MTASRKTMTFDFTSLLSWSQCSGWDLCAIPYWRDMASPVSMPAVSAQLVTWGQAVGKLLVDFPPIPHCWFLLRAQWAGSSLQMGWPHSATAVPWPLRKNCCVFVTASLLQSSIRTHHETNGKNSFLKKWSVFSFCANAKVLPLYLCCL